MGLGVHNIFRHTHMGVSENGVHPSNGKSLRRENEDSPVDLGVSYFQTHIEGITLW